MSALQLSRQLDSILEYLQPYWKFTNCHMVNFLTDSHWENFIPIEIRDEIKSELDIENAIQQLFSGFNGTMKFTKLKEFVAESHKFRLENLKTLTTSLDDFNKHLNLNQAEKTLSIKEFMSEKKRHEVEISTEVISNLLKSNDNSEKKIYIIDAGDGKGYLSSRLSLQHSFNVLGIDASEVNTKGAETRNKKLQRHWNGIFERAEILSEGITPPRRSKKQKNINTSISHSQPSDNCYKTVNKFITTDLDFKEILKNSFNLNFDPTICLVGLHTCGNLASTCLKMFSIQQDVRLLFLVGCCYHLLNEEFMELDSFANLKISEKNVDYGFPLSNYLRKKKVKLGRNSRMLASQSIHRTFNSKELPNDALFYRALFEQVISEKHPELKNFVQVGKLKKFKTFLEYFQKCNKQLDISIDEEDLMKIEDKFKFHKKLLNIFYLIRMHFAPILETIILLDRLLFLKENGIDNTFLIQLFDPILSPRCFSIISIK